jgi:glycosyltransferase involved in cell wall biosynthesis
VELRQKEAPFQAAVSNDAGLAGLFVPARRSRPHLVRATSEPEAWAVADEATSAAAQRDVADRRKLLRQAQGVFASCRVVADAVAEAYDMDVPVIRPPAPVEPHTGSRVAGAPRRYLLMCGPLDRRHGAETLAAALPMAWRTAADLTVVLAGDAEPARLADWRTTWRDDAERVTHLDGLGGGDLVALAARAVAVVVPALADDLDEMAQQALAVGVPVIATAGAGTAELVEPGVTGTVVPGGSPNRLADALAAAWTGTWGVPERVRWQGSARAEMAPDVAAAALLAYVADQRERWRDA